MPGGRGGKEKTKVHFGRVMYFATCMCVYTNDRTNRRPLGQEHMYLLCLLRKHTQK